MRLEDAQRGLTIFSGIPLRYVRRDLANALSLAERTNLYAYDAYFLDCASRHSAPLLTLDGTLRRAATAVGLNLIEI